MEGRDGFRGRGDRGGGRGNFGDRGGRGDFRGRGDRGDFRGRGDRGDFRGRGDRGDFRGRGDRGDFGGRGGRGDFRGRGDFGGRGGGRGGRGGGGPPRYTGPILTEKRPSEGQAQIRNQAGALVPFEDPMQGKPEGTLGQMHKAAINYFRIKTIPNDIINVYDVQMDPGSTIRMTAVLAKKLWMAEPVQAKLRPYSKSLLFNGRNLAWSYQDIPPFTLEFELGQRRGQPDMHTVAIREAGRVNMQSLIEFLGKHYGPSDHLGRSAKDAEWAQTTNILDMILRDGVTKKFFARRSTFFDNTKKQSLDSFLEIWHGFYQSVRPAFSNLCVNFDKAVGVFWIPHRTVLTSLMDLMKLNDGVPDVGRLIANQRSPRLRTSWNKIKGVEFYCKHLKGRDPNQQFKLFKIKTFSGRGANEESFEHDGQQITVQDYFRKQYNIELEYPQLRCIENAKGNKFPMEVCWIAENQPFKTLVHAEQMSKMITITTNRPPLRHRDIMGHIDNIKWHQDPMMLEYGMTVDNDFMEIPARVLPLPRLQYGRDTLVPDKGQWNLRGQRLVDPKKLNSWAVAAFVSPQEGPSVQNFVSECTRNWGTLGIEVTRKNPPIQHVNPNSDIQQPLEALIRQAGNQFNQAPELILFIVQGKNVEPYRRIKRILDGRLNVVSQGVLIKHVQKASPQYCANVGMKVNAKLGGSSVRLTDQNNPALNAGSYMVMGADTAHPAPGATDSPTIAAVTASNDKHATRFTSVVRSQGSRVELIAEFQAMSKELLQRYHERNNRSYPQNIFYFRDGVSEGQYQQVLDEEVSGLRKAIEELHCNPAPKITVSIFGKRHNTRIWPRDMGIAHEATDGNVVPGTIIENGSGFDFYVVPHKALQGTARPAHVEVILNETKISVNAFQAFVYNLCHVFARSTTSVSLVPPVYYAHLTCERARAHVNIPDDTTSTLSGSSDLPVQPLNPVGAKVGLSAWFM